MNSYDNVGYHFAISCESIGLDVDFMDCTAPEPEKPYLIYNRVADRSNLRLVCADSVYGGPLTSFEWYTLQFNIRQSQVDEVLKQMLELGYNLEVVNE